MVYFYGLDAFRAIAAILVIFGHVELIKSVQNLPNIYDDLPFFMAQGELAVTFFFVLSGFLITYLLLIEKEKYGKISFLKFYLRRIFRIWPLYFLITLLGFYYLYFSKGFTDVDFTSLYYYLAVLPNLAPRSNPLAFQSWSIGVEEQFYILWPLIFLLLGRKTIFPMLTIIVSLYLARVLPVVLLKMEFGTNILWLKSFFDSARFDNMAIGGGLAYMMHYGKLNIPIRYGKYVFLFTIAMLTCKFNFKYGLQHLIYSFIFALNIYFIIKLNKIDSVLESRYIKYLGKISYGIYMWHIIAINFAIYLTHNYFNYDHLWGNIFLHLTSILLTIMIASVSYELYENQFLKMKVRYATYTNAVRNAKKTESLVHSL